MRRRRPKRSGRLARRDRLKIKTIQVIPTLITAANLLAGLLALAYLQDAMEATDLAQREEFVVRAAWLVFVGMFCDALDGRIARLTGSVSAFGAQLDSLADVVTFGVVPAILAKTVYDVAFPSLPGKLAMALVVVYLLGAAMRLARYNVESARTTDDESAGHVTLVFRGLPSPAAAGVIAALLLLRHQYGVHSVEWALLLITPLLGLLMVSRLPYVHLLNRYFEGSRPLAPVVFLVLVVFLVVVYFEETVAAGFFLYAASGPAVWLVNRATGWLPWVEIEEEDEHLGDDEANGDEPDDDEANDRDDGEREMFVRAGRRPPGPADG